MTDLPNQSKIKELHKKYAPSEQAYSLVHTHCLIVWEIAQQIIEKSHPALDRQFIEVACLLHDIGVYRLYLPNGEIDHANYIKHGVLGYELLKDEGFAERLCRIASCHTGVGLTRQEVIDEKLPLHPQDYVANNIEERLVMYADKFHTKHTPPNFISIDTYREQCRKFGEQNVVRFNELIAEFGQPDLKLLAEKYGFEII